MERVKNKLHKDEQKQIEKEVKDIKMELVECLETRRKSQDNLPQEQRETICSLEADHDQVSPVSLCEVERALDVKGYMPSFGVGGGRSSRMSWPWGNTSPLYDCVRT